MSSSCAAHRPRPTQYLQSVLGFSPLRAALWSLVPMAGTMLAAPLTKVLVERLDRAYVASGGFVIAAAGFASLSRVHAHSPIWFILIAATVYAGGIVGVMSVGNELIMGAVPPARAGAAAAVVETASELGGALGMAVLGSIGIAAYHSSLTASAPGGTPPAALAAARDTLGGAVTVAGRLPGPLGNGLLEAARTAFHPRAEPSGAGSRDRHGAGRGPQRRVLPGRAGGLVLLRRRREGPRRGGCRAGRLTQAADGRGRTPAAIGGGGQHQPPVIGSHRRCPPGPAMPRPRRSRASVVHES